MGGVINVITREPKESFSFTLEMDAGNYGSKNLGDAELGGRLGAAHTLADLSLKRPRWNPKLTSDLRRSEGFDLDKLNRRSIQTDGDEGLRWNLDPLFALTPPGGGKILLSPRYYKEDKEHLFSTNVPGLGQSPGKFAEEVGKWHITLGGKMPLEEGSRLSGTVAYEQLLDISSSSQDIPCLPQLDQKRTAVIELSKGEVQWHIPMRERHLFMAGAVAGRETLTQEQVSNEASGVIKVQEMTPGAGRRNYEAYLQDDIFLASRLELLPGIRYQVDSDFGLFVAPRINLMAKAASSVNLRLGYGKGYRVPTLRERFFFFDHSALGYQVLGNPDLTPEPSGSFQAGTETPVRHWIQLLDDALAEATRISSEKLRQRDELGERLPALRERREDIPLLAKHFLAKHSAIHGKKLRGFTDKANDFGARYKSFAPGRIIAYGGVHPRFCDNVHAEMTRLLDSRGIDADFQTYSFHMAADEEQRGFLQEDRAFLSAILDGSPVPATADDGYRSVELVEAVYKAIQTRERVRFENFLPGAALGVCFSVVIAAS